MSRSLLLVLLVGFSGTFAHARDEPATADQQSTAPPPIAIRKAIQAVERFVEERKEPSIQKFLDEQLSNKIHNHYSNLELRNLLHTIRIQSAGFEGVGVDLVGPATIKMEFEVPGKSGVTLLIEIDLDPPHQIANIQLENQTPKKSLKDPGQKVKEQPLSWEMLENRLRSEEAAGFAGVIMMVRDRRVVLYEGYGMANRDRNIRNTKDTLFAIGSIPINFTKAAILKLEELDKLKTSDPIGIHLPNVPKDKTGITIDHLMTGRSGLRNFHERPEDSNLVFSWIDRTTALTRILNDDLLFAPGTEHSHSHSAFGVLAAIVEYASGTTYNEFLREQLFKPAGMTQTGHYEDSLNDKGAFAVGYGDLQYGRVNSPPHWGKTSWLVKGSGGMVSTPGDLHRWVIALRTGKVLSPASLKKHPAPRGAVLAGGNAYGFFAAYTEGSGSRMFLCSNTGDSRERTRKLVRDLATLVQK